MQITNLLNNWSRILLLSTVLRVREYWRIFKPLEIIPGVSPLSHCCHRRLGHLLIFRPFGALPSSNQQGSLTVCDENDPDSSYNAVSFRETNKSIPRNTHSVRLRPVSDLR